MLWNHYFHRSFVEVAILQMVTCFLRVLVWCSIATMVWSVFHRQNSPTPKLKNNYKQNYKQNYNLQKLYRAFSQEFFWSFFSDFERPLLEFPPTDLHENLRKWSVSSALSFPSVKTRIRALILERFGCFVVKNMFCCWFPHVFEQNCRPKRRKCIIPEE